MAATIVLAGATGNLGTRIARALSRRGAKVVALARAGQSDDTLEALKDLGAEVRIVDLETGRDVADACGGAACVVSALQGLKDVIVDTQTVLLEAAVAVGVPRFIPSDFSSDFTKQPVGENRNFDLRRQFRERLDAASVAPTSIFNGAFAEILTNDVPLLDFKKKTVGYWEDADWKIDFTTMDDTAAYTAAAALDPTTPRDLRIASFRISPKELATFTDEVLRTPFELVRLGSLDELRAHNASERAAHPEGENELYPQWQQGQYMQSMFSSHHDSVDDDRYPDVAWTELRDALGDRS